MGPLSIAGGLLGAGLNAMAAAEQNAAITKQANANWETTLTMLDQQRDVTFSNLQYQAQELNAKVGMQLTDLGYQAKQATGKVVASATERNVYGATAMKVQGQVSTDAALMEDSIIQGGEAATNEIQISLANAKYQRDSGVYQASMDRANMLNQRAGGSEIAAGMFSSAVKFGQAGYNLEQSMG